MNKQRDPGDFYPGGAIQVDSVQELAKGDKGDDAMTQETKDAINALSEINPEAADFGPRKLAEGINGVVDALKQMAVMILIVAGLTAATACGQDGVFPYGVRFADLLNGHVVTGVVVRGVATTGMVSEAVSSLVPTNRTITVGDQVGSLESNLVFASSSENVTKLYNPTNALEWYEIRGQEKWTYTVTTHSNLWSYSCEDIYSLENTSTLIAHAQSGFFETNNPPLDDNYRIITPIKSVDERFFYLINFGSSWIFFSPDEEFSEATGNNAIGDYSCSWGDVKFKWLGNGFTLTNITVSTLSTASDLSTHNSDATAHAALFSPLTTLTNKALQRVAAAGVTTVDLGGSRPTLVTLTSNATLGVTGLYPYYPAYLMVQGDYSWGFSNATYWVGGAWYQTNRANHYVVWTVGTNLYVNPVTTSEVLP